MRHPFCLLGASALFLGALASCTIPTDGGSDPLPTTQSQPVESEQSSLSPQSPQPTRAGDAAGIHAAVDEIAARTGAQVGVALTDRGGSSSFGELLDGPAWSTIKVPIALAALDACIAEPALVETQITAALTASDNAAALWLWECLGDPDTAAQLTEDILAQAGSSANVQSTISRPSFSSFGQTEWSLSDQALFAQSLPELVDGTVIAEAMQSVVPDQSYGLGTLDSTSFKGGWGPDLDGTYLVRQFGFLTIDGRNVGIALAAKAPDGTYESGQSVLTELAQAVQKDLG